MKLSQCLWLRELHTWNDSHQDSINLGPPQRHSSMALCLFSEGLRWPYIKCLLKRRECGDRAKTNAGNDFSLDTYLDS